MGARGPQPTPTEILKARGSRKIEGREGEVQYQRGRPRCPKCLGTAARREWRRMVRLTEAAGVLQLVDRALLAAWCEAWGEFVEARYKLTELGRLTCIGAGGGEQVHPLVKIKNAAAERMVRLAAQFGFSPAARCRIRAIEEGAQPADGKSRFFNTVG